jgi:putative hydrolase of the HAD superfamily
VEIRLIKAVVFDFDGLILDTETVWYESYRDVMKDYEIEFPMEIFLAGVGTHGTGLRDYFNERANGRVTEAEYRRLAAELHSQKMVDVDLREGVREFLAEAKALGLRIGLASSSSREWVEGFLRNYGLYDQFEVIKTSDDVTHVKPDPELYLKAVEALGVQPAEAIAFEDSMNGAIAAKAAGLTCIIVPNPTTEGLPFVETDWRIRSMADQTLQSLIHKLEQT